MEEIPFTSADVEKALTAWVTRVVKDHREKDLPLVVWKDGRIEFVKPWE